MAEDRIVVWPSEAHTFAYCPRLYFFELYLGRERSLWERFRLLIGRVYHYLLGLGDRVRGRRVEEPFEARLGAVTIRGRPDAFEVSEDHLLIVERKSSKPPRKGAWTSDAVQASIYALILSRMYGHPQARIRVEYPGARRESNLDSDKVALVTRLLDDIVLVKYFGIVPKALRSPRKCGKCPFREVCEELDRKLDAEDLYEPGSWLEGRYVDETFS